MNENNTYQEIYDTCKQHMHAYVMVETTDGAQLDGIITGLDDDNLYLAVPDNASPNPSQQVFTNPYEDGNQAANNPGGGNPTPAYVGGRYGRPGYGYGPGPGYGYGPGLGVGPGPGYGYRRPGRFSRVVVPLAALATLALLPWY